MKKHASSRRTFLQQASLAGFALPLAGLSFPEQWQRTLSESPATPAAASQTGNRKIAVFSKALQWTELSQMADMVAEAGLDGLDLTVRPGGHVEPERVKDELPRYAEAMKKVGKEIVMLTTAINSADEPYTKDILATAGALGIGLYRMNWYAYDKQRSIEDNLVLYTEKLKGLAALNETHQIQAGYQNHSGASIGSPVWDLGLLLRQVNSPWVGSQYDIRHAVVEGANSWSLGFEYVKPYINSIAIKDFLWGQPKGKWEVVNVPLGKGLVDFGAYFERAKTLPSDTPITLHQEYDLGGAEHGHRTANITPVQMVKAMKDDLEFLKQRL